MGLRVLSLLQLRRVRAYRNDFLPELPRDDRVAYFMDARKRCNFPAMTNYRMLVRALQWLGMLNGRIGRSHYWLLLLVSIVIVLIAATMGSLNPHNRPIQWLSYGILLSSGWPVFSATTRRLRG